MDSEGREFSGEFKEFDFRTEETVAASTFFSSGYSLLPPSYPSILSPFMGWDDFGAILAAEGKSEDQARAILWTVALQDAFEATDISRNIPGFSYVTYGFANAEFELDAFAVIVYTAPSLREMNSERPSSVVADGVEFPIIYRPAYWKLHSVSLNPANGTATSWAYSKKPGLQGRPALLTAKHVVSGQAIGSSIPLSKGNGTLLDLAPEGIDAALIEVSKFRVPAKLSAILCPQFVAQWTDVDVDGLQSGSFSTKITEVNSGRGTLHPSIPLRVFLAHAGQPGDSGALVRDKNGFGIGLYMGEVTTPANVQEGFCQHLGQVEQSLNIDLHI
jgi:hypothetical protein